MSMNSSVDASSLIRKIDDLREQYDWTQIATNKDFRKKACVVDKLLSLSNQTLLLGYERKAFLYYAMAAKTAKRIGMIK